MSHKPALTERDAAGWAPNVFPECTENCGPTMLVSGKRERGEKGAEVSLKGDVCHSV